MDDHHAAINQSHYRIRVKGRLDTDWSDWFDQFSIEHAAGYTLLTGAVVDQSALLGLLIKLNDLGLTIIAVNQI